MDFGFSSAVRLRRGWQFDLVFRTGRRETGELVRLFFVERPDEPTRVGVTVGRKVGKGFYDYDPSEGGSGKRIWPGLAEHYPLKATQPSAHDLKQRILYVQAVEGARAMEEGVLLAPADGDIGSILGVGFPAYTGGPFCFIDGIGLPQFVAEADRLADLFGEQLRPPQLLRDMAARGQTFYGKSARA